MNESIELEDGLLGMRLVDKDIVVEEVTIEVKMGEIVSIDYSKLPLNASEEDVVEVPERVFRAIASGNTPESLPQIIERFKEERSIGD